MKNRITVTYWIESGGPMGNWLLDRINLYNNSQSEFTVKPEYMGEYDQLQNKMMTSFANGSDDAPVLASLDYRLIQLFAEKNYSVSLSEILPEEFLADYYPCLMDDMKYKGEIFGLPYNRSNQGIYINCDLWKEVGLDPQKPPKTWDEFISYGERLTDYSADMYGTYSMIAAQWWFEMYVIQAGGRICDDDGNFIFNNDAGISAAQYLQDEVYKYKFARVPDVYLPHHGELKKNASQFVEGKIGMFRSSPAMRRSLIGNVDFEWDFIPVPAGKNGKAVTNGGANTIVINHSSPEQKKGAADFMQFMASPETITEWVKFTGYIPVRKSVAESKELQEFFKENPSYSVCYDQIPFVNPTAKGTKMIQGWQKTIDPAMSRIINQREDVATVINETVENLQNQLHLASTK